MKKIKSTVNRKTVINTGILFIIACFINFYLTNKTVFTGVLNIHDTYRTLLSFSTKLAAGSIIILALSIGANFSKKFSLKIAISSVIYLLVNYVIIITRNLNNKKFNYLDIIGNNFFQTSGLLLLSVILLGSLLIKYLMNLIQNNRFKGIFLVGEESGSTNYLVGLLISLLFFKNDNLGTIIQFIIPDLTVSTTFSQYLIAISKATIFITFLVVFVIYFLLRTFSDIKHLNSSLSLAFITSLGLALLFNYSLQYGVKSDTDLLGRYIYPGATSYQIFILTIIFLFVCLLFNRFLLSTLIILLIGTAATVANILKEKMRSEPLLITDLTWFKEIKLVITFVDEKIILYVFLSLIAITVFYFMVKKFVVSTPIISNFKIRLGIIFIIGFMFIQIFNIFKNEENEKIKTNIPVLSTINNYMNIEWMGFSVNARYKSIMYVWTKQLTKNIIAKPKNYNEETILKIAHKYEESSKEINKSRSNSISDQTVIYVLSESLANPNRIDTVLTSQDVLTDIEKIKSQTTSGLMKSDGFGGGTANMEFQSLTGLPYYNFSTGVSTLYSQVVPKLKVFPSLSNYYNKKDRFVMHPSGSSNYNRENVYHKLGFDNMIFSSGSKQHFIDESKVGVSMSDDSLYKNVLLKINPKESQFFSVITMQNHALWSVRHPENITASGKGFSEIENDNLTEYSRLLTFTDNATYDFLNSLTTINKDITVVFYGDHLPGFYPESAFENNLENKYLTDYFIWSNHDNKKIDHSLINSSDFTAALLEHTNSKVSPYQALLTDVLLKASVSNDKDSLTYKEIQDDLKNIQYDITLGKGYILQKKHPLRCFFYFLNI